MTATTSKVAVPTEHSLKGAEFEFQCIHTCTLYRIGLKAKLLFISDSMPCKGISPRASLFLYLGPGPKKANPNQVVYCIVFGVVTATPKIGA